MKNRCSGGCGSSSFAFDRDGECFDKGVCVRLSHRPESDVQFFNEELQRCSTNNILWHHRWLVSFVLFWIPKMRCGICIETVGWFFGCCWCE